LLVWHMHVVLYLGARWGQTLILIMRALQTNVTWDLTQ
jgi:hypothetical protein